MLTCALPASATVNSRGNVRRQACARLPRSAPSFSIGVTGLALFIYLIIHLAGNLLILFGPDVFNGTRTRSKAIRLIPIIEIGLLLVFLVHLSQDRRDVPGESAGAPGQLRAEDARRGTQPQELRFLDDDSFRALAAGVPRHPREGLQLRHRVRVGRRRSRSLPPGDGDLQQPAHGRLSTSSACWSSARTCGTASSSALQSLGMDHPTWTPRILFARQGRGRDHRRRLHRHRHVGARRRGPRCEARRQDSGRPDRATSGTGTSSR